MALRPLREMHTEILVCIYLFNYYSHMDQIERQIIGLLALRPDGLSARELRAECKPGISQPTLWRRLESLRARGKVSQIGRGRSTRYVALSSGHEIADLRSRALHIEVGKKLLRQPKLVEKARSKLGEMKLALPYAKSYLDQWESLLDGPIEGVLQVLGAEDERAKALRHTSPFAGLLSERERLKKLRQQGLLR